jgi:hypothetical protein
MLARGAVIVSVDAEFRRVAEDRLELGSDRRVIGASEGGRRQRGRGRGGEKLNDERERDNERDQRRRLPRRAKLRPTHLPLPFEVTAVHVDSLLRPKRERRPTVTHWCMGRKSLRRQRADSKGVEDIANSIADAALRGYDYDDGSLRGSKGNTVQAE